MRDDNYWLRLRTSRLSRRRFVGGAAANGLGAASFALVGCGDDDDDDATPAAGGTTATAATGTAQATETATASTQKGGVARFTSANNTWDTFDVDRSRFTPVAWLYGYTNLGIVQWRSFIKAQIEGGLAEEWEQPDETTTIFKLRPNVFWHDKPPVNGRQATADDIAAFIIRNKEGKLRDGTEDVNFYRKGAYASVDSVQVTDETTVRVTHNKPDPFFINSLATSYSKVMAPEAIDAFEGEFQNLRAELVIGTGAFVLEEFAAEGRSRWRRHDKFHQDVNWDGIEWIPLFTDQAAQQAAFEQKQIDAFNPTNPRVRDELLQRLQGQISQYKYFTGNPQAGTYYGGAEPWNNKNIIGAIFRAFDRRALVQGVLQGQGVICGNVPPAQAPFALSESELITFPGYLEDREKEKTEARQMWEAGGGPALGDIIVDIPDIWEGLYSGGSALITNNLKEILGNNFVVKIEPYSTITTKIVQRQYGNGTPNIWWGWISEVTDLDPTTDHYRRFNSASDQFPQFGVKVDRIDELTNEAVVEFDIEKRQELSKEIVRELIRNYGAGIPYTMNGIETRLAWNYYPIPEISPFVETHLVGPYHFFKQDDPTWQGRPS